MNTEEFCVAQQGMASRYADSKRTSGRLSLIITIPNASYLVVFNVLYARALQAHIPSSSPIIITSVDPGFCNSDLLRNADRSIFEEALKTARTSEEGSRQLLYASLGPDPTKLDSSEATQLFRGAYIADQDVSDTSPWVTSEDGAKVQERLWVSRSLHHFEQCHLIYL